MTEALRSNISKLRKKRLLDARTILKKITDILIEKYRVRKIILIGSLADEHRFGFHSDIDLCVEGLSDKSYFMAVGELLMEAGDLDIDIIPLEDVTPEMRNRILQGKVLYEKPQKMQIF